MVFYVWYIFRHDFVQYSFRPVVWFIENESLFDFCSEYTKNICSAYLTLIYLLLSGVSVLTYTTIFACLSHFSSANSLELMLLIVRNCFSPTLEVLVGEMPAYLPFHVTLGTSLK